MFCSKCGVKQQDDARFCRKCGESLVIETVEHTQVIRPLSSSPAKLRSVYANATRAKRFTNYFIDLISIYALTFVASFVIIMIDGNLAYSEDYVFTIVAILVMVLYYSICEYFWGKTLGKLVTKTRVLSNESVEIDFWTALRRSLIRLVPLEVLSLDNTGTMWHDRWTSTRVADEDKLVNPDELQLPPIIKKPWSYGLLKNISSITMWVILVSAFLAFLLGDDGTTIFNLVLGILGVLGFVWLLFGLPLGLIDFARKSGKNNYNGEHNAAVMLGGLVVLGMVFSAYALAYILNSLMGIDLVGTSISNY